MVGIFKQNNKNMESLLPKLRNSNELILQQYGNNIVAVQNMATFLVNVF